jgi:hypothetical protein
VPPGFPRAIRVFWLLSLLGANIDLLSGFDESALFLLALQWRKGRKVAFEDSVDLLHGFVRFALHVSMITLRAPYLGCHESKLVTTFAAPPNRSARDLCYPVKDKKD